MMKKGRMIVCLFFACMAFIIMGKTECKAASSTGYVVINYPDTYNRIKAGKYYFWEDKKGYLVYGPSKTGKGKRIFDTYHKSDFVTNGRIIFYSSGNNLNEIWKYDIKTKKKKKVYTVKFKKKGGIHLLDIVHVYKNTIYYYADENEGKGSVSGLFAYNMKSKKLKRITKKRYEGDSSNGRPTDPCPYGKGKYFFFYDGHKYINKNKSTSGSYYLYNCKTRKRKRLLKDDPNCNFRFQKVGNRFYVAKYEQYTEYIDIYIFDTNGKKIGKRVRVTGLDDFYIDAIYNIYGKYVFAKVEKKHSPYEDYESYRSKLVLQIDITNRDKKLLKYNDAIKNGMNDGM